MTSRGKANGGGKTGNGKRKRKRNTNEKTENEPSRAPAKRVRRVSAQRESRCTQFCICEKLRKEERSGQDKDEDDDDGKRRDDDRDKGKGKDKAEDVIEYGKQEPKYTDTEYRALADRIEAVLWQGQTPRCDLVELARARSPPNRRFSPLEEYVRELFNDPILILGLEAGFDTPKWRPVGLENLWWTKRYSELAERSDEWGLGLLHLDENGDVRGIKPTKRDGDGDLLWYWDTAHVRRGGDGHL
jgi:hypothetical protein